MKNSIRNQAIELLKNHSIPLHMFKLIHRMIGLSNTYEIQNYKCLKIEEDIPFSLLGRQVRRHLSMDEQSVVQTILLQEENKIALIVIENIVRFIEKTACDFYSRLFLRSGSNSTFTRSPYVRSKKRINFFSLLNDNRFFLIENLVSVEEAKQNFKVFILGHPMGQGYKKTYSPKFSAKECVRLPGQTTKFTGLTWKQYFRIKLLENVS